MYNRDCMRVGWYCFGLPCLRSFLNKVVSLGLMFVRGVTTYYKFVCPRLEMGDNTECDCQLVLT